ncbi:MAG: Ribosomal large subunit pseudouridine synthase B [Chloroflexi bacterium]|nr:Ribosomal large subunit pseudouridine synthase B [Chloroflexota bacterium]
MSKDRLQKILARAGHGSRRGCERLIAAGRVRVNQKTATLGMKADPEKDEITVDGEPLPKPEPLKYIALHKPRGVLSTVKTKDTRPTVRDLVNVPGRLYPVGRLDVDSEGLILMTNDGKLTNRLTHPRYEHKKEYRVQVKGSPSPTQVKAWRRGVTLENGQRTLPAQVSLESQQEGEAWLRVTLREGRKRQIRRMGRATGLPVQRIIRTRIASLRLGNLSPRKWRHLSPKEVKELKE